MNIPLINSGINNFPRSIASNKHRDKDTHEQTHNGSYSETHLRGYSNGNNDNMPYKQMNQSEIESIKVYVRARPISAKEISSIEPDRRHKITKKEENTVRNVF